MIPTLPSQLQTHLDTIYLKSLAVDQQILRQKGALLTELVDAGRIIFDTELDIRELLDIEYDELFAIVNEGRDFSGLKITRCHYALPKECHASAAFTWVMNPTLELYTGLSDRQHQHSWLYSAVTNEIYEPTPESRQAYFGYRVLEPLDFVAAEEAKIREFLRTSVLPIERTRLFEDNLKRIQAVPRFN